MFEKQSWYDKLPSEELELSESHLQAFFKTMFQRQHIWHDRFVRGLPAPWTDDPIMRDNKFTNVYRELDRNSIWLIENVIKQPFDEESMIFAIMLFRFFNEPNTFSKENGGMPWYRNFMQADFERRIKNLRRSGVNPYTTAYAIWGGNINGGTRDDWYCRIVIPALRQQVPLIRQWMNVCPTADEFFKKLLTVKGGAAFTAHEFYQDFTYIKRYTGQTWFPWDQNDFTNVGPGASVGLRLIFPNLKGREQKQGIYRLRDMAAEQLAKFGRFPYLHVDEEGETYVDFDDPNITLHQIEMWLCEYQKYWKMLIGQGKQRSKFKPRGWNV